MKRIADINYYIFLVVTVLVGIFLRLKLYALDFGLHHDEANLALNLMNHSYLELFSALDRNQVAPALFMVLSKGIYSFVKLNYTASFSDHLLKFLPLCSGIIAMPAFICLLNRLFKDKIVNLIGAFGISFSVPLVFYSNVFKQYSIEVLVSIVILIVMLNLDFSNRKKSIVTFAIIGLSPFMSLSSIFILIGIFLYLVYAYLKEKNKNILYSIFALSVPILLFCSVILPQLLEKSYQQMFDFWQEAFNLSFSDYLLEFFYHFIKIDGKALVILPIYTIISCCLVLFKNKKLFFLTVLPFLLVYLAGYFYFYPLETRLVLFIYPSFLIILLFPITLLNLSKYYWVRCVFYILFVIFLMKCINTLPITETLILKPDYGLELWKDFYDSYDNETPVIFAGSINTQRYYVKFFPVKKEIKIKNWQKQYEQIPKGTYYILSNYDKANNEELKNEILSKAEVYEYRIPEGNKGFYIKFKK